MSFSPSLFRPLTMLRASKPITTSSPVSFAWPSLRSVLSPLRPSTYYSTTAESSTPESERRASSPPPRPTSTPPSQVETVQIPLTPTTAASLSPSKQQAAAWKGSTASKPYTVQRTFNGNLPVYKDRKHGGTMVLTMIRRVQGLHTLLKTELEEAFQKHYPKLDLKKNPIVINSLTGNIIIKGDHVDFLKNWLVEKGF